MKLWQWQAFMRASGLSRLADVPQEEVAKAEKQERNLKAVYDDALKRAEKLLSKGKGKPS